MSEGASLPRERELELAGGEKVTVRRLPFGALARLIKVAREQGFSLDKALGWFRSLDGENPAALGLALGDAVLGAGPDILRVLVTGCTGLTDDQADALPIEDVLSILTAAVEVNDVQAIARQAKNLGSRVRDRFLAQPASGSKRA